MKTIFTNCLLYLALVLLTTGCKTLFSSEGSQTKSVLQNFDEAENAFNKIITHKTTVDELKQMGFDLETTPNVKLLTYLDIIERFIPNQSITKADLPLDVLACIESKNGCHAYELTLEVTRSKRYGNLCLDVTGFQRKTHITGWTFKSLIIIRDNLVTYKLRSGQPKVDRLEKRVKPLGPFQDLEGLLGRMPGMI